MIVPTVHSCVLAVCLRLALFTCALFCGVHSLAQSSYIAIVPTRSYETRGGVVTASRLDQLRYAKGEAGGTGLTMWKAKGAGLPNHLQKMADGLFRDLGIRIGPAFWGDDLRTFVVARVNLGPLVGDSNVGVFAVGMVRSDQRGDRLETLEGRVAVAVEEAVQRLARGLESVGINERMWEVLCAAGKEKWGVSGVPYELCIVDDAEAGNQQAWDVSQQLIAARRTFIEQLKFANEKTAEEARFRAARIATLRGLKSSAAENSTFGIHTDPKMRWPIAWYWKAWDRIDRDDYGPQTGQLVEQAEQALAFWEKHDVTPLPLLILERKWDPFGIPTWDGNDLRARFLKLSKAYVNYLRGIYYAQAATRTGGGTRQALEYRSAISFVDWQSSLQAISDDPIMDRAAGIAAARGIRGFESDPEEAIRRFESAARNGTADAFNWLGLLHDYYGAPQLDRGKAKAAYERGIAQGSLLAPQNLAILHLFGAPGVPQSFERYNTLRTANDRNRPNVAWRAPLLPTSSAPERNGNRLAAAVVGAPMPRVLVAHPSGDPVDGRDVRIEVDYTVASGVGQLVLDFSDAIIGGRLEMMINHPKAIRVEGSGKEILWLGGATYGYLVGNVKIRLLDASGEKELNATTLPFAVRWDPGQLPQPLAERPIATKLSDEQLAAMDAEFKQGQALAAKGDFAGAEKIYDSLLARLPESGPVRIGRATVRWNQQKQDAALADVDEAIRLKTPGMHAHRLRALFKAEKGDLPGALADVQEAVRRDPGNAELLAYRGGLQSDLGKPELALADFNASLELNAKQPVVVFSRARLHEARGDADAAVADYGRVLQLEPKATGALLGRARIRFNQLRWDDALVDQRRALELDPEMSEAARAIGYSLFGRGDYAAAFDSLNKAVDLAKGERSEVYAALLRHVAARRLGREDQRLATAWGRWTDDPWAQALARYLVGRATEDELEKMVAATTDADEAKGRRCEMHYYIGCVRLLAGDKSTARLRFEAVVGTGATSFIEYALAKADLKRL
jgi:tetratricopeptide (TPR) repeat protein